MTRVRAMQFGAMAAGASFAVAAITVWAIMQGQSAGVNPAPTVVSMEQASGNLRMTNDVRVYNLTKDAVVNITSSRMVTARVSSGNDFFDRMMPDQLPTKQFQAQSLGSGFVIHPSGYIVTNEHVVEEGAEVQCVFFNGEKLSAKVIATDNDHDLAVLKVEPKTPLHAIALGSSEDLMIGEPLYAIGNPFGYAGTMTSGIVSALDRSLDVEQKKTYKGLIQTNASINPGNSGGPLINAYGQVVGINTAIRQGANGIGFAISVSSMRDLLPAFLNPEALAHAKVGFSVKERRTSRPPADVSAAVLVEQVQAGSDADKAGLKNEDQLVTVGGAPVKNVVDALVAMGNTQPGDSMALEVMRGAKTLEIKVPVTKAPPPPVEDLMLTRMGVKGRTVVPALVSTYKLAINQGIYIDSVEAGSPAAKCQIQAGDVVFQLGRYRVASVDDLAGVLKLVKEPVDAQLVVIRGNNVLRGTISLK